MIMRFFKQNLAVVYWSISWRAPSVDTCNFPDETKLSWNKTLNAIIRVIETGLKPQPTVNNKGWALQLFKKITQSRHTTRGLFLVFSLYLVYMFNRKRGLSY